MRKNPLREWAEKRISDEELVREAAKKGATDQLVGKTVDDFMSMINWKGMATHNGINFFLFKSLLIDLLNEEGDRRVAEHIKNNLPN